MQATIDAFFKPSTAGAPSSPTLRSGGELPAAGSPNLDLVVTYERRRGAKADNRSSAEVAKDSDSQALDIVNDASVSAAKRSSIGKVINKKRNYAQYYLEFGQSDFLLHSCSTCGMRYARGDEDDEKVHKTFHNNYYQGIPFKGWSSERVISTNKETGDRIILVLDGDPPAHKHKVMQVVYLLEGELGLSDGWLLHKHCKVYLFVSKNRIVSCVFAEPIKEAYRVISDSMFLSDHNKSEATRSTSDTSISGDIKLTKSDQTVLRFGNISFQRQVVKRKSSNGGPKVNAYDSGTILCEEKSVPALCGIRAIWVVPSRRRQHIATEFLDSIRKNFEPGRLIEASKLAFSQPTSSGKAFASTYSGTRSFLVYKAEDC